MRSLDTVFTKEVRETDGRKEKMYRAKPADIDDPTRPASWLSAENIARYSPKFAFLLDRLRTAEGCCFVYTRFVHGGAIPLALALEANGYTPYNRRNGLLADGIQSPGGRQCAMCPKREQQHTANDGHAFVPAVYGILTGDPDISPNNEAVITAQRAFNNVHGKHIKVMIGSQISSEGVDFRFVRETHVLDAWYHLNKTEQILGRAIRFLSHCALEKEKRNNTVYLYTNIIPNDHRESVDLYSYRVGFIKAVLIGNVSRIMKQSALDCNLNHDAIIIKGEAAVRQIDAQRMERRAVDINDMPYTAVCDWTETCDYKCNPQINVADSNKDDSSYDEFSSRWRIHQIKQAIKNIFIEQTFIPAERLLDIFQEIPQLALVNALQSIVNNKTFQVRHKDKMGYIRYCNGYYVFQPNMYSQLSVPLAIRAAQVPIKRDLYVPIVRDVYLSDEELELEHKEEKGKEDVAEEDDEYSIINIWGLLSEWIRARTMESEYTLFSRKLVHWYKRIAKHNKDLEKVFDNIVDSIHWFYDMYHASTNKRPDAFRAVLTCHFWDMWLSFEDQKKLIASNRYDLRDCCQYAHINNVDRLIHPATNAVEFICGNAPCTQVQKDIILGTEDEPIRQLVINTRTTGEIYGVIVPKNERFIFKLDTAENGKKSFKGSECAIVSSMTPHIKRLLSLMEIIEPYIGTFGIETITQKDSKDAASKRIVNSKRICTVTEFLLRYMDIIHMNQRRWFYRPLEAYYIGYRGAAKK
jgi:hypothetical protein